MGVTSLSRSGRVVLALGVAVGLLVASGVASADEWVKKEVTVKPGDTLGGIAAKHGVSVKDIRSWNPRDVKGDVIKVGAVLVLKVPGEGARAAKEASEAKEAKADEPYWVGHYSVRPGDNLGKIARRLGVGVDDICRWNNMKRDATLRVGQSLRYEKPGERPDSESIGRPTAGKLKHGVHLGKGKGYRLRFPKNAYGLASVNKTLRRCAKKVTRRFPGTAKILIGDISKPTGGHFPPHQSHQSGRDADIGYYLRGNKQNVTMHRVWPRELDYGKNWTLLRCLIREDAVVRIYMDEGIQKAYAKYLKDKRLAGEELINRLFQAVSTTPRAALIRHAPKHDTHMHVRFACDADDARCEEERGDEPFEM